MWKLVAGVSTFLALDAPTRALVTLAGAMATGNATSVESAIDGCLAQGVSPVWIDELLLQSTLMIGWPRALLGAAAWRRRVPRTDAAPAVTEPEDFRARGEAVCRIIYGPAYARLRANVRAIHPELDDWMITEGYGRTLSRPGLDLARRELCIVAQVAFQGAEPQLHSHIRGALHAGVSPAVFEQVFVAIRPLLGSAEWTLLTSLWKRIRPA